MSEGSSGGGSTGLKVLAWGSLAVVAGGAGYLAYRYLTSEVSDDEPSTSSSGQGGPNPLQVARAVQARAVLAGPARPASNKARAAGTAAATKSVVGGKARTICATCEQPCSGLPLRCGQCKKEVYCSQPCQKKAWPQHKKVCKPPGKQGATGDAGAGSSNASPAVSSSPGAAAAGGAGEGPEASSQPQPPVQGPPSKPMSVEEQLARVLQDNAASQSDQLEAQFETAVMLFLRGDYRQAVAQLSRVQMQAREREQQAVEGEVYKWLGHCWNKLADVKKAESAFVDGLHFAKEHSLPKLEIDCLGGLGIMNRTLNQPEKAAGFLRKALELSEEQGDEDSVASMLCNLGAVEMQLDKEAGLQHLRRAVDMREAAIERMNALGERAGLATAVMEHANANVNLASALYVTKRLPEAKEAYEKALEIFELVQDLDKCTKILVNLANMCELQMRDVAGSRDEAASFRARVSALFAEHAVREPETECTICLEPIAPAQATAEGKELIMLACYHTFHDKCWSKWVDEHPESPTCPTCKQAVTLFTD